jgi:hypothetical protein
MGLDWSGVMEWQRNPEVIPELDALQNACSAITEHPEVPLVCGATGNNQFGCIAWEAKSSIEQPVFATVIAIARAGESLMDGNLVCTATPEGVRVRERI